MKKNIFTLLLFFASLFGFKNSLLAQNNLDIVLNGSSLNLVVLNDPINDKIHITSSSNSDLSGLVIANNEITISPSTSSAISIFASDVSYSYDPPWFPSLTVDNNPPTENGGGTTVIRTNTGGPGINYPKPTITIYPNPVNDLLNISSTDVPLIGYEVYDLQGYIQKKADFDAEKNFTINVSQLPKGNYILILELKDNKKAHLQFIKE